MPVTYPDCVRTHLAPQRFRTALLADWTEALFIHYAVDPAILRPLVPAGLELDLHGGRAFVSLVAFTQRRLRPRFGGRVATALSRPLAEHHFLNLRTYVRLGEEQGIYFLAEWIPNRLACLLGPALYGLPYHLGKLTYHHADGIFNGCVEAGGKRLQFEATIDTARQPQPAESHTLDEFLVERYTAFTNRGDQLYRFRIAHAPWKLTAARVKVGCDALVNAAFSPSPGTPGEGRGGGKFAPKTAPSLTPFQTLPRSTRGGDKKERNFAQGPSGSTAPLLGDVISAHYSHGLRDVQISPPAKVIVNSAQSTRATRGRVVIAGGSGFLRRAFARHLRSCGYEIVILSRNPSGAANARGIRNVQWDGVHLGPWLNELEGAAAVINLAGKNVNCRYTTGNLREIDESRANSVNAIGQAIRACNTPPPVWIQAGSTAIYGNAGDRWCDETTPAGTGIPPQTCLKWEAALAANPTPRTRQVLLRIAFVLGPGGGVLQTLGRLARCFLGGAAGAGRQYISWIHIADVCRVVEWAIERPEMSGVYVVSAGEPVPNAQFMQILRRLLHRPWSPRVPAWVISIGAFFLRTEPVLALTGRRCVPRRLIELGFPFEFTKLKSALNSALREEKTVDARAH